MNSLKQRGII